MRWTRRSFLSTALASGAFGCAAGDDAPVESAGAESSDGPRLVRDRVAFITDEYSSDLAEAIAFAKEFDLEWVELRNFWDKYGFLHDAETLKRARAMLDDAGLKVACLSTPILKCIAPGVEPVEAVRVDIDIASRTFPIPNDEQFDRSAEFVERAVEACSILGTDTFRIFSFWRAADAASSYPLLIDKIAELAPLADAAGMKLAMENEHACNVADCGEAMQVLPETPANVGLIWDVLNGASTGETPYPDGYEKLDKSRIFHVQLKDADLSQGVERFVYRAVGDGDMPYGEIFRALARDGYPGTVSMETHFRLDGSLQQASRRSMQGILRAIEEG